MIVWWLLYCTLLLRVVAFYLWWWYETINVTFCKFISYWQHYSHFFSCRTRFLTTIHSHACCTMKGYILDKYLHGRYEDGIWSWTLFWDGCPLTRPDKSAPSNLSISPPPSLTWPGARVDLCSELKFIAPKSKKRKYNQWTHLNRTMHFAQHYISRDISC